MATKIKQKKIKPNKIETSESMSDVKKVVLTVSAVVGVFLLFLIITTIITNNQKKADNDEKTVIQYDNILIASMLSQKDSDYYVFVRNEDDDNKTLYSTYISLYKDKSGSVKVYNAFIDDIFNKEFIAENSNLIPSPVKDIRFKETTLVHVKDGSAINYYEGHDSIVTHFNELIK